MGNDLNDVSSQNEINACDVNPPNILHVCKPEPREHSRHPTNCFGDTKPLPTEIERMKMASLSREEQLRQWQKERRNKRSNGRSTLTGSSNRKMVKVKVRGSKLTPGSDNDERNKNPSLRLYEQGTVASRMKSKTPTNRSKTLSNERTSCIFPIKI